MVHGFGVISIISISIGLDGIAMVFNGSQPLSVNDPLDRMVGNGFWRDIHWTQWNGMIFICSQPLAKWSFGNQPSLRGSWHYGRHWHGTLPDLLSKWSTRKVVDEKIEDDFLSTNTEMLNCSRTSLIRLPLEVWMSNRRSWYFGPELSWFEVLQFVSSEQCMVIPQIYNCQPCSKVAKATEYE